MPKTLKARIRSGLHGLAAILVVALVLQLSGLVSIVHHIDYWASSSEKKIDYIRSGELLAAVQSDDVFRARDLIEQLFETSDVVELDENAPWDRYRMRTRNGRLVFEEAAESPNPEIVALFAPFIERDLQEDYLQHYAALMERSIEQSDFYTAYQAGVAFRAFDRVLAERTRHRPTREIGFYIGAFAAWSDVENLQSGDARFWLTQHLEQTSSFTEEAQAVLQSL